jgi:hypothetical protein
VSDGGIVSSLVGAAPLSDNMPITESSGAPGGAGTASRGDHTHPRLSSATSGTLNASGEATITFTRSFAVMPCIDFTYIESADNPPIVFKVKIWVQDGGSNYIGCIAKGYRGQVIPQNLVSLLVGAVFNVFGGSATGIPFTCIALQPSA